VKEQNKDVKYWLEKARKEKFAIGAFNAANIETFKAIVGAARKLLAPVIIEASHGEVGFVGGENLVDLVENAREELGLPIFTNLDHAPTVEDALAGIDQGFKMIHFNGSKLSFGENMEKTREVVRVAHKKEATVEAEIDAIVGTSTIHRGTVEEEQKKGNYTDPEEAALFVEKTGIDILAAFVGNVHGVYSTSPKLDIERLKEIGELSDVFLSLHGGSGIEVDQVKKAIKAGIVKVNVNSEMRIAYRKTLEEVLKKNKEVAIYKIMPEVIKTVQEVVEKKIKLFGSNEKV